jgi:hypothetical protein
MPFRLLVEGLLGYSEGVNRGRHSTVENHLCDDLGYFLFSHSDVQGSGDVPLDQLWAMAKDNQRSDGAETASPQVNGGAVIDLAVNYRVDQPHNVGRQFEHRGGWLRIVVRTVITHPELGGGLLKVDGL